MKKIKLLGVIAVLILMMGMPAFADSLQPIIGLTSVGETQKVKAGEQAEYTLTLYNNSNQVANNIKLTISGDHPFKSDVSNMTQVVSRLNPREHKTVTFSLYVSPMAEQGYYEFDVAFDYLNIYGTSYSTSAKVNVDVENSNVEPIVGIVDYHSGYDTIQSGVEDGVVLFLKNAGTLAAKDIRVTLSGFSNTGILLDEDVDLKSIKSINAGDTVFTSYKIKAGPNAVTGVNTLTAKITYIDGYGHDYTKETALYFDVEGLDTSGLSLKIDDVTYPETLHENQSFDVSFKVANTGSIDVAYAEIAVDYPSGFVAKTPSKKVMQGIKAGETYDFTVTLMPTSDLTGQNFDGWVNVDYYVKGETKENIQTLSEYLGFFIEADEAGSKPKLIINNYEYGGENVLAGEPYTLKLYIRNTSNTESTRNIKVTLESEDSVFTPVNSSSSFFIGSIRPSGVYEHEIILKTKIDASVKIYALTVKMEYEDGNGNAYDDTDTPYSETEDLSIAVAQPVRLETADIIVPWEVYAGQPFYIEQEFYNMGKSTMYNMMVKMAGVESSEASYFVGNFDAGSSDYYSAQAYAYEEGTYEGSLTYSFEDALGNVSIQEVPFSYTVMPMMETNFDGGMDGGDILEENMMGSGGSYNKFIIALVVIATLVIGFILRKRHKAKLNRALEELDD